MSDVDWEQVEAAISVHQECHSEECDSRQVADAFAAERARADAAEGREARLREALERVIEQADAVERDDMPTLDLLINAEAIARAALAADATEPACSKDRHIVLSSGEACVCGEHGMEPLL